MLALVLNQQKLHKCINMDASNMKLPGNRGSKQVAEYKKPKTSIYGRVFNLQMAWVFLLPTVQYQVSRQIYI